MIQFAKDNNLMFFPTGFPSSWIRRLEDGGFKQFIVLPDDKNIDKICELWLNDDWNKARDKIEQIIKSIKIIIKLCILSHISLYFQAIIFSRN